MVQPHRSRLCTQARGRNVSSLKKDCSSEALQYATGTVRGLTFPLFFVFQRVGFHATRFSSC